MMRFMDKRIYFTLVSAVTVSGFIAICTMGQSVRQYKAEMKLAAAATEQTEPLYTIREHCGRAGIFCRGNNEPFRYADINIFLLPESDREQIREGMLFRQFSYLAPSFSNQDMENRNKSTFSVTFLWLAVLFCVCLVASNLFATKVISVFGINLPGAVD